MWSNHGWCLFVLPLLFLPRIVSVWLGGSTTVSVLLQWVQHHYGDGKSGVGLHWQPTNTAHCKSGWDSPGKVYRNKAAVGLGQEPKPHQCMRAKSKVMKSTKIPHKWLLQTITYQKLDRGTRKPVAEVKEYLLLSCGNGTMTNTLSF